MMGDRLGRFDVQRVNQIATDDQRPLSGVVELGPRDWRVGYANDALPTVLSLFSGILAPFAVAFLASFGLSVPSISDDTEDFPFRTLRALASCSRREICARRSRSESNTMAR